MGLRLRSNIRFWTLVDPHQIRMVLLTPMRKLRVPEIRIVGKPQPSLWERLTLFLVSRGALHQSASDGRAKITTILSLDLIVLGSVRSLPS